MPSAVGMGYTHSFADKDSPMAFSKGAGLGFGITALLALCLIMIM